MIYKPIALLTAALCLAMLPAGAANAVEYGDTLVGNVFVTGYDGWTDTNTYRLAPDANWGVLLTDTKNLIETSNTILGPVGTPAPVNSSQLLGTADVWKLVKMDSTTPGEYTVSAKIGSWDDDGFGLIFGYQDENNYYRVTCRAQNSDSYGIGRGVCVAKVVDGTITHLAQNKTIQPSIPTLAANTNGGVMFDLAVTVTDNGDDTSNWEVTGNFTTSTPAATMTSYASGTNDADLNDLAAGHYGVLSWAQYQGGGASKCRGTEVESVSVASSSLNVTHTFSSMVTPVNWRPLKMTNANGVKDTGNDGDGNFRQSFTTGVIEDDSNSYEWATTAAANVDFIGQAVVVDEPGNASWTDYEMTVRVECSDNEGPGVLVRVQDDKTFYRINFAAEALSTGTTAHQRAPQGLSIQKCDGRGEGNPVWTELFRDAQGDGSEGNPAPKFVYGNGATVRPFDLKVKVVGNEITVQVIDDPDGAATVINYDPVVDNTNPILAGSVALTNWGGGSGGVGPIFSAYGGEAGHALLIAVPEPSMLVLLGLLAVCGLGVRRRS